MEESKISKQKMSEIIGISNTTIDKNINLLKKERLSKRVHSKARSKKACPTILSNVLPKEKECFDYIEGFYNTRRIHSALDNKSPKEYEK